VVGGVASAPAEIEALVALDGVAAPSVARGLPHCPQNLNPGGLSARQLGQELAMAEPHWPQNLSPDGFSN
jgi:hypothetical protein